MKKILHIINDEKFINNAKDVFSSIEGYNHTFLILGKRSETKYIRKDIELVFYSEYKLLLPFITSFLKKFDGYIIHSLSLLKLYLLRRISSKKPIVWIGWGADYYSFLGAKKDSFILPMTKAKISNKSKPNWKQKAYKFLFQDFSADTRLQLLTKVDLFNTVIYEDYNLMSLMIGTKLPDYVDWNYPVFSKELELKLSSLNLKGNNLLLGNSFQATNNHIDALNELKSASLNFDNIICPLSYGIDTEYRDQVILTGKKLFKQRFTVLTSFLPFESYMDIISSCKYFYLPTIRQQAVGNANVMLSIGASLILNRRNPLYWHYLNNNVKVFSSDDISSVTTLELTTDQKKTNKDYVAKNYSLQNIIKKTDSMLSKMFYA